MPIFDGALSYYVPEIPMPVVMVGTVDIQPVIFQYIPKQKRLNSEGKVVRDEKFYYETTIGRSTCKLVDSISDPVNNCASIELIYEYRDENGATTVLMGKCMVVVEYCSILLNLVSADEFVAKARIYPPL